MKAPCAFCRCRGCICVELIHPDPRCANRGFYFVIPNHTDLLDEVNCVEKKYNPFFLNTYLSKPRFLNNERNYIYCQQKQKSNDLKQLSNSKIKFARVRYDNSCHTFFFPHIRWCHRPSATSMTEQFYFPYSPRRSK